jgi:hypothetical protein
LIARTVRRVVPALIAMAMGLTARSAGAQASLYVPLDDIAYRYADALIARGELRGLSLIERPYTARQLAAGADTVLMHPHSSAIRSYAIALRTALQRYTVDASGNTTSPDAPRLIANADVFSTAQSSGERELMQADSNHSVTGGLGFRLAMVAGPVAALVHPVIDNRLNNDPDFSGRKDRAIAGRTEDAYVAGQWQYAEAFLGRIARNWGPYTLQGQQLGSAPYTYDHAYLRVGTDAVHIAQLATRLDDAFRPDGVYARWFYTHRLGVRWRDLEIAATEGFIADGIGRSVDPSLLNPLNIYALSWRNERVSGNLSIGGNLAYRTRGWGTYASELFIDNLQIDRCTTICHEPSSYGFTASAEGIPLWRDQRLFASYARLSGLAYRNKDLAAQYTSLGIGLGEPFADYDEARVGVDLAAIPYTTLRLYGAYRRQGQGDYHLPYPTPDEYATTRGFLQGVVERVARVGVSGGAMLAPGLELTADVGVQHLTNADHLVGTSRNMFAGRARVQWTPRSLTF